MHNPNVKPYVKTTADKIWEVIGSCIFFAICVVVGSFILIGDLITYLAGNVWEITTGIYLLALGVLAIKNYFRSEKLTPMAIKLATAIAVSIALAPFVDSDLYIRFVFVISSFYVGWRVVKLPVDLIGAIIRAFKSTPNSTQNTTGDPFYDPR